MNVARRGARRCVAIQRDTGRRFARTLSSPATKPPYNPYEAFDLEDWESADGPQEEVSYAVANTSRTVDKSKLSLDRIKRFDMTKPFPGVPAAKPFNSFERPETYITELPSGLRVASQETYGQLCTVGVIVDAGSIYETDENEGVSHLLESMGFKSTKTRSHEQVVSEIEKLGGIVTTHSSREQMLYCVDVLRDALEPAMELLSDAVLQPVMSEEEVEEQKEVMSHQMADMAPDLMMKEALQAAAYPGQGLGRPHYCPLHSMDRLTAPMLRKFHKEHFIASSMVVAGAGVRHDEFVALTDKYFANVPRHQKSIHKGVSRYVGGEARLGGVDPKLLDGQTRVCIAFEVGGWDDDRFVPSCVLQTLLGGGDSFSAGGPGKGMYSRLYRKILNQHFWAEAAEAFTSIHNDTGLLGIAGASKPERAADMLHLLCNEFVDLAMRPVDPIELSRAKNMLKCNVLTQLESRLIVFEDIGRQVVSYGRRDTSEQICERIDRVTAEDIKNLAYSALSKPPSIGCVGASTGVTEVPTYADVIGWFTSDKKK